MDDQQASKRRLKFTREKCIFCDGTGANNPDAPGDSMHWRNYLPCTACYGTGFKRTDHGQSATQRVDLNQMKAVW